ncbi:MAG: alanine racemase [Bacteroidota bacterium]
MNNPAKTCFLALDGERTHGRVFAQDLSQRGVGAFILPGEFPEAKAWLNDWPFDEEALILLVESSLAEQSDNFGLPQVERFPESRHPRTTASSKSSGVETFPKSRHSPTRSIEGIKAVSISNVHEPAKSYFAFKLDTSEETILRSHTPPNRSLKLLQRLAAYHRRQLSVPIVAITGTHGKTIVKDWLAQLLSPNQRVYTSPRSYNSQIGLPLSVWGISDELHDLVIIEAGISQAGEMGKLAEICQPDYGIFTVFGDAHRAGFVSTEEQLQEKMKLFDGCQWVVSLDDSNEVAKLLDNSQKTLLQSLRSLDLTRLPDLPAPYQQNAHTALVAALRLGVPPEELEAKMSQLSPLANRLQTRSAPNNCLLIDDSYSNDLTSLAAAIDFAKERSYQRKLTLFLSDLLQSGRPQDELYIEVASLLIGRVDRLFLVGQSVLFLPQLLPENIEVHSFHHLTDLQKAIPSYTFQQETILLKGARVFGLEELADQLLQRRHHTRLEIDTEAIVHNLNCYRSLLKPKTTLSVMVKASAYGSGDLAIAQLLASAGVDWFFVAYANEGIALRKDGLKGRILVLNPLVDQLPIMREYALEPIVHNRELLEATLSLNPSSSEASLGGALLDQSSSELFGRETPPPDTSEEALLHTPPRSSLRLHLELDSGMSRLGFSPEELPWVIEQLKRFGVGRIDSLMSHLAAAEAPEEDEFSQEQADRLLAAATDLRKSKIDIGKLHLLNSSGIIRHAHFQFDLVRLGIGLYGIGQAENIGARTALRMVAPLTAIRTVRAGQTVSYSRNGKLKKNGRIGVVGMGYADGLPRLAGNGRFCFKYGDYLLPTVGNICMDMCMIDLSEVRMDALKIGNELTVFGPEHPIELLASAAQTIPYEILTGIGSRVQRIYIGE